MGRRSRSALEELFEGTTSAGPLTMRDPANIPDRPPKEITWRRKFSLSNDARQFWADRELIRTLAERDIRARYAQAVLGAAWTVLTPLLTVFVFTLVFKKIGSLKTGSIPYPLQTYTGLLPWQFFTSAVSSAAGSLIMNNSIINKMRCAREVFPIAAVTTSLFDMVLAMVPFAALFVWYGYAPKSTTYWVLPLFALQLVFTIGLGLALSTLTIYVRDVRMIIGGILSVGLFLSPVAWPVDKIQPAWWQVPASIVNPFVALIDGYRRAVLSGQAPSFRLVGPAACTCLAVGAVGYVAFRRTEIGIVDIA